MSHIFVSYARNDHDFVSTLEERLKKAGLKCWVDRTGLRPGEDWQIQLDDSLRASQAVIVVVTPHSRRSEYVTYEWSFALGLGIPIIPILRLGEMSEMHPKLSRLQALDFTAENVENDELWKELEKHIRNLPPPPSPLPPPIDIDSVFNQRGKLPDFAEWLAHCEQMWVLGRDLVGLCHAYWIQLQEAAAAGKQLRFLIANPQNEALIGIFAASSAMRPSSEDRKSDIDTAFHRLVNLEETGSNVKVRLGNAFSTHSYIIADGEKDHGQMIAEIFGHKIAASERFHLHLTRAVDPKMFQYHLDQFDKMWNDAEPWTQMR